MVSSSSSRTDQQVSGPVSYTHLDVYKRQITTSTAGGTGGVIDPSVIVNEGDCQSIAWKAQEGYRVAAVIVDGIIRDDLRDLGDEGQVSFEDIHENHSVTIIYKEKNSAVTPEHFVVETSIEGEGSITPSQTLNAGADLEIVFKPAEGWATGRDVYKRQVSLLCGRHQLVKRLIFNCLRHFFYLFLMSYFRSFRTQSQAEKFRLREYKKEGRNLSLIHI